MAEPIEITKTDRGKQVSVALCPECHEELMYIPAYHEYDEEAEYICLSCDYRYII